MTVSNQIMSLKLKLQGAKYVIIRFDDKQRAKNWQARMRREARWHGFRWRFLLSGTDIVVTE